MSHCANGTRSTRRVQGRLSLVYFTKVDRGMVACANQAWCARAYVVGKNSLLLIRAWVSTGTIGSRPLCHSVPLTSTYTFRGEEGGDFSIW